MRAIINGKRYDTETATLVGESGGGNGKRDFKWWEGGLYKTPRSGQFFLAGEGGPMTRFHSRTVDGMYGYGSKIIPLTDEEALEWAEQELDEDAIEEHFSDKIEDA